ncbi:PAS domain-containing protein [Streptomyces sp. NBC_00006]|uniref:PAS domain-containing protein n=1 Tax=unclassified Streptomyces TaxID=2593676 RepID=UPI00224FDA26|nr:MULTISPECIES: PAS domain-containing protein [unclassified Streptomyces]MCX4830433.1 PAS domain-containing protein [Streptomyces sp. NBC_01016]MCX5530268.1 PAS domain-containing protein [Streptomyces sp. NBC_00006]
MAQMEEFDEELADFVRRVAELKTARSVSTAELPAVLDAALFELDHVAAKLWPHPQQGGATGTGTSRNAAAERHEQQLLRAVFQRLPLPVALVDREAVVRRLNFAATTFTGVRAGYATGRPMTGFLAHADRAAFRSQVAAVARGEGDRGLTVHLQQNPQAPVRTILTGLRPGNERRTTVLAILQPADAAGLGPTSARPAAPVPDLAETTRHAALTDLLDAMARELLGGPLGDPAELLRHAAHVLHGRFADWVVADKGAAHLERIEVLGPDDEAVRDIAAQDPAAAPLVVEAARGGAPALLVRPEDLRALGDDASGAPVLVRADVTSLLCVPLIPAPGEPVQGVLTLFRSAGRLAFSMAEAKTLDMMARHIALAMRK